MALIFPNNPTDGQVYVVTEDLRYIFQDGKWNAYRQIEQDPTADPITFDQIANKPATYPPSTHSHSGLNGNGEAEKALTVILATDEWSA